MNRPIFVPDVVNVLVRGQLPNGQWEVVWDGQVMLVSSDVIGGLLELEAAWLCEPGEYKSNRIAV